MEYVYCEANLTQHITCKKNFSSLCMKKFDNKIRTKIYELKGIDVKVNVKFNLNVKKRNELLSQVIDAIDRNINTN